MARAWEVPGLTARLRFREAAGRVILTRWHEMMSHLDGTLSGQDIEDLHAMRVSSRRLRAALDAFAAAFPERGFRRRVRRIGRITEVLGGVRDLDVAIDGLTALLEEMAPQERPGVDFLIAAHVEEREHRRAAIATFFAEMDRSGFARDFERWVERHTGVRRRDR